MLGVDAFKSEDVRAVVIKHNLDTEAALAELLEELCPSESYDPEILSPDVNAPQKETSSNSVDEKRDAHADDGVLREDVVEEDVKEESVSDANIEIHVVEEDAINDTPETVTNSKDSACPVKTPINDAKSARTERVCPYFASGQCRYGSRCKDVHIKKEVDNPKEILRHAQPRHHQCHSSSSSISPRIHPSPILCILSRVTRSRLSQQPFIP